jgi:hypothetical protein
MVIPSFLRSWMPRSRWQRQLHRRFLLRLGPWAT